MERVEVREGCWSVCSSLAEVVKEEEEVEEGRVRRRSFLLQSAIIGRSGFWFNCTSI